jgi:hypothetical protein
MAVIVSLNGHGVHAFFPFADSVVEQLIDFKGNENQEEANET